MLYAISAALAVMSGWTAYKMRLGGKIVGALVICALPLLLALPLFVPSFMTAEGADGMGALGMQVIGLILFGPSFLAAVIGTGIGWLKARE